MADGVRRPRMVRLRVVRSAPAGTPATVRQPGSAQPRNHPRIGDRSLGLPSRDRSQACGAEHPLRPAAGGLAMFIPDKQVQAAFDILNSPDHAKARAAHEYAEKRLKVVLAKAQLGANGKTVGEREATALASEEYEAACKHARLIAEAYYSLKD